MSMTSVPEASLSALFAEALAEKELTILALKAKVRELEATVDQWRAYVNRWIEANPVGRWEKPEGLERPA